MNIQTFETVTSDTFNSLKSHFSLSKAMLDAIAYPYNRNV